MAKLVIISGSPSPASRLNGVLQSIESVLQQEGVRPEWIRVHELPPEDLVYTRFDSPAISAYALDTQVKRKKEGGFEVAEELEARLRQSALDFTREALLYAERTARDRGAVV
ncbi:FMN reductase [Paenibacillus elgii]|uniref:FMN reductase n=1 Tax=Paenibacillus elgii TaxID=189691 RepID=UPI000248DF16|nr:FMN reductase [Paenibacillus elgii]